MAHLLRNRERQARGTLQIEKLDRGISSPPPHHRSERAGGFEGESGCTRSFTIPRWLLWFVHRELTNSATETPMLPSNRAQRLQEATSSIENLYRRSTASTNDNRIYQPVTLASRHMGSPLNRDVLDGQVEGREADSERFTLGRRQPVAGLGVPDGREGSQLVVDARSLGARSEGRQSSHVNRDFGSRMPGGNHSAVDARSLGAKPEGKPERAARPSLVRRTVSNVSNNERRVERPMFLSRSGQGGNSDQSKHTGSFQQRSPRDAGGFQQGSSHFARDQTSNQGPGSSQQRSTGEGNGFQQGSPRFSRDQTFNQGRRASAQGRPMQSGRRSRVGGPRASRDSSDSEPRPRKRGAGRESGRGERRAPEEEKWTEEEQQYMKERAERKAPKNLDHEPLEYDKETFTGMGPATASDGWGLSEMLGERLLLARKYLDHDFVQWDSREQKADVMAVVKKLKAVRQGHPPVSPRPLQSGSGDDEQAQALMQKLVAGEYAKFKQIGGNDVLGHVERHVHRNDSFYPDDERSLLEKVKSIMPAQQASKIGRGVRSEVKA